MNKILSVELTGQGNAYTVVQLPLTPYEMLDTLDKLRMTPEDEPDWEILGYETHPELRDWIGSGSVYELNALCAKLAELDEWQSVAFEGLVEMEKDKGLKIIPMHRLLDLAYSTEQCHVLGYIRNPEQFGRFAAENGFLPEADGLPDKVFELLDFQLIGEKLRLNEGGVFTKNGYVVQDGDLAQDVWKTLTPPAQKPEYTVLLALGVTDTERTTMLSLPASPAELDAALGQAGAELWSEISWRCADCRVPALRDAFSMEGDIGWINDIAATLSALPPKKLVMFKAVIEAAGVFELTQAVAILENLDEYVFSPQYDGPEAVARNELNCLLSESDVETLLPHLNLYAYGKALIESQNIAITTYGGIERQDGQPVMERTQPTMGGMEVTQA